jgi:DNA-binding transcriptional regulator YiaG
MKGNGATNYKEWSGDMLPYNFVQEETKPNKLTHEDVREIRASNLSTKELSKIYGVSKWAINDVKAKRSYKEVK